jgi:Transglutaminase family, C-terminal ig like domain/Domain of unknown function DUF11
MRTWLRAGAVPLAGALALVAVAAGQSPTRLDPVIEFRQKVPTEIDPDEPVAIEIHVRNSGKGVAEAVTVTDLLRPGVELVDADPSPARGDGHLCWCLGRMAGGQEQVVKVRLKRAMGNVEPSLMHTVEVAYHCRGQNNAEAKVRQPVLGLAVAPVEAAPVGTPATVRITVTNPGNFPVKDVTLQSVLLDGLTHPAGNDLENSMGTLEAGQTKTVNLTLTPKQVGDLTAKVKVHARGMKSVEDVARVKGTPALLSLSVTNPPAVEANRPALFEMVVGNDGPESRKAAELVITLPKDVIFVRATDRGTYDPVARTVKWDLGEVRPGERRSVVWNGIVKEPGKLTFGANLIAGGKEQKEIKSTVKAIPADGPTLPDKE